MIAVATAQTIDTASSTPNGINMRGGMWINDVERKSIGRDVKSVEFTVDCVVVGGTVTESERTTGYNICHPTLKLRT